MTKLRERESVSARALEFSILTAARTSEVIGAKWDEIDLKAKTWTIPGERMTSGREHRVPLSPRAVALLMSLPREKDEDGYVLIGAREGKPLSNMAILALVRGMTKARGSPSTASAVHSAIGLPNLLPIRTRSWRWHSRTP